MTLASPLTLRSRRKPKGEGHARRAEILAAAERIFVEHGYEGATIRKIADEVGLSSTAQRVYRRFDDVIFEQQRCRIDEIRPIDVKALKAATAAQKAAEPA